MCGIFGSLSTDPATLGSAISARHASAEALLRHRGPDDSGLERFSLAPGDNSGVRELVLGHTRLSIIDLSADGRQPMRSDDGRFCLAFNGEIYNYLELREELKVLGHSFSTESDTEVLLAAWAQWGHNSLSRLTGMFAFVIYDTHDKSITLVRDAFGIKPLYYFWMGTEFRFASELPALFCLIGRDLPLNLKSAYEYLLLGDHDKTADTFSEGVQQLQPGHWMRIDLLQVEPTDARRWWWPSVMERTDLSFDEAASTLRELFLKSVKLHMRSDVKVGAALSGGIDSSAVVCAMRYLEPDVPIHTFSYVARGSDFNEEKYIDIVNEHVGAIQHKVIVKPEDLAHDLKHLINVQGEPFGGTSIYAQYRIFKAAKEAGIVVTLDGQGADELLAGYEGYPDQVVKSLTERGDYFSAIKYLNSWRKSPGRTNRQALASLIKNIAPEWLQQHLRALKLDTHVYARLINKNNFASEQISHSPTAKLTDPEVAGRCLACHLRSELTGSRLNRLLRYADRNAMAHSIESRVPFLTTELAEFALTLPEKFLVSPDGDSKYIFREAMRGLVPDEILDRRDKIGFDTPLGSWMKELSRTVRLGEENKCAQLFYSETLNSHLETAFSGKSPGMAHEWRLLNLILWGENKDGTDDETLLRATG